MAGPVERGAALSARLQQFTRNDPFPDFGCAFVDAQGTDFAAETFHDPSLADAAAAERRHGMIDHALRRPGGGQFRLRSDSPRRSLCSARVTTDRALDRQDETASGRFDD